MSSQQITPEDLERIGAAVIGWTGTFMAMGHAAPSSTVLYVEPSSDWREALVRDLFALCDRTDDPEAAARIAAIVERFSLLDMIGEAVMQ